MPTELLLTGERKVELVAYEEEEITNTQVRAQAVMSAISHGTEISLFRGTSPFHNKSFDPGLRLFTETTMEKRSSPTWL